MGGGVRCHPDQIERYDGTVLAAIIRLLPCGSLALSSRMLDVETAGSSSQLDQRSGVWLSHPIVGLRDYHELRILSNCHAKIV
jgi:hypothetical protein